MSTQQMSFKSTVRRSSRLNPTFKKKLGFQKLEIEFISSKPKKCPQTDSNDSPVLFDSQDDISVLSRDVDQSKLDVEFATEVSARNSKEFEEANSQNSAVLFTGVTQFTDAVSQSSATSSFEQVRKFFDTGLNSQNITVGYKNIADTDLTPQDTVTPCIPDFQSAKTRGRSALKSKPLRKQRRALNAICDGNILPEYFRKSTVGALKKVETEKKAALKQARPRNKKTPFPSCPENETNASFEAAKEQQPVFQQKREGKPRASNAAKSAKGKSQNNFPDSNASVEPLQVESVSQSSKPKLRKPKSTRLNEKSVNIIKYSRKKQSARASNEMELCSLLSNCSIKSNCEKDQCKPFARPRCESVRPRQNTTFGTTGFIHLSLTDLYKNDADSANADDLSDLSDLFSMTLNVGNFSENLNIMSLLRQITKIEKKLHHFVPAGDNWYEDFEIW